MTCYGVSAGPAAEVDGDGAAGLPEGVPADQTNI